MRFEVIDVTLIPGYRGGPREAWVAIGTLTSYGRAPWAASYWDDAGR